MTTPRRVHLIVRGRVQGVFYRSNACASARRLGLTGWVRNEADGSVHAIVDGARADVEEFISWCHRGSPAAKVERIEVEELRAPHSERFDDFQTRR